jgi:hypothetical protein
MFWRKLIASKALTVSTYKSIYDTFKGWDNRVVTSLLLLLEQEGHKLGKG